jgi:predicted RNA binding protein YcfA (HicA-like mRNA interferase family)
MRTPRDLSAQDLVKMLSKFGYRITRQKGSHIRLTLTNAKGEHHVTVPNHDTLKLGTLSFIIADVTAYLGIDKEGFFS